MPVTTTATTVFTPVQRQRLEALEAAGRVLAGSPSAGPFASPGKNGVKPSDIGAAITLAEYVVNGREADSNVAVTIDEDGISTKVVNS